MNSNTQLNFNYGFSQGRLTSAPKGMLQWFPQKEWHKEFQKSSALGCSFVELLLERVHNPLNPFWSKSGREKINLLNNQHGLTCYSVCLDYIIDNSILNPHNKKTFKYITKTLDIAEELNCKILILPLLEASDVNINNIEAMSKALKEIGLIAAKKKITICLETLLTPENLIKLLNMIGLENIKLVFDTGNRVNQSKDLKDEIIKLNKYIGHIHIKDKDITGNNVLLGSGLVNFYQVFCALNEIKYKGSLNFETTRGKQPIITAKFHIELCRFFNNEVSNGKTY